MGDLYKIAIASNFTCEPVQASLDLFLNKLDIGHSIEIAPFNQIFQQLLVPTSSFRTNDKGFNVIVFRIEDLVDDFAVDSDALARVEQNLAELRDALLGPNEFRVPLIVVICPPSGLVKLNASVNASVDAMETGFINALRGTPNLSVFSGADVISMYGVDDYDDPRSNEYGRMPYTQKFYAALGGFIARRVATHVLEPKKVVVLDCDQTLWKGVCGEDGIDGIEFDLPRLALQRFMREQSEAGMLICICSKNNEPDVWNVFETRPEMLLSRDHIVASRINWNFKSQGLRELADELDLALGSFIFVDDDPAVCAEVRANCPDVLTLQLPTDTSQIPRFLDHVWAFDKLSTTAEDRHRTESYRQQVKRSQLEKRSASIEDFLAGLEIECTIARAREHQIPRISQLTLRTNQFNATTIRRSEAEVRSLINPSGAGVLTVTVRDKFGDYGLVGLLVFEVCDDRLDVESFMLSCRALGRGIEHRMVSALGNAAVEAGRGSVDIRFVRSAKNTPIRQFLDGVAETPAVERDGHIVYRLPAGFAANLEFRPERIAPPGIEVIADPVHASPAGVGSRNAGLVEIASLTSASAILDSVKGDERKRVSTVSYAAPKSETQARLVDLWRKNLNISEIGIHDNFFELGGDSLLAVSLFVDIEEELGRHLPLTTLVESPTIEAMAAELDRAAAADSSRYLVPLRTGGSATPLFCMHAAGGNVLFYRDLAAELDESQPVYGLQARGVADRTETAHESVSEMAVEYLKEIRAAQPVGPYKLCGSSFGGLIAYEMACQLNKRGEEVAVLALFDTYAPGYPQFDRNGTSLGNTLSRLNDRLALTRAQLGMIESTRGKAEFIAGRIKKLRMRARRKRAWKLNQFDIAYAKATGRELPENVQRNHLAIQKALDSYHPDSYSGPLSIYRASMQPQNANFDEYLGWGAFAKGPINVFEVPGSHGALTVYPFAKKLAETFGRELEHGGRWQGDADVDRGLNGNGSLRSATLAQ